MVDIRDEVRDRVAGEHLLELQKAGMAPHPESPSGRSLLASYRRWQEAESAKASAAAGEALRDLQADVQQLEKALRVTREEVAKGRDKAAKRAAKALRKARKAAAIATPTAVEDRAQRLAEGEMRTILNAGGSAAKAVDSGFAVYRRQGGKLAAAQWMKKVASKEPVL